jgi:hypothetical protein
VFFFVDESGHTGTNLFDESQPVLYYGVLSCDFDFEKNCVDEFSKMRSMLGVERLHANEIGINGLLKISNELIAIQKKFEFIFDFNCVHKPDLALINFFDQVFDPGLNPAVPKHIYWTPLRYTLLVKLSTLFDKETLQLCW